MIKTKSKSKTQKRNNKKGPIVDEGKLAFRGLTIKPLNVKLAFEKAKAKHSFKIDENKKIPKIEAYVLADEDFNRIHKDYPDSESFTRFYWHKITGEPELVMIFIRASIFESNRDKFYGLLVDEAEKILFICNTDEPIYEKRALTIEEYTKEVQRLSFENPDPTTVYAFYGDGIIRRVSPIPTAGFQKLAKELNLTQL